MEVADLVAYYNTITQNISILSQDVISFADGVRKTLMENFSLPEEDDQIHFYEHFSDTLEHLKNLPDFTQDFPDFEAQTEDYTSIIDQLRARIDSLLNTVRQNLPELTSVNDSSSEEIPTNLPTIDYPSSQSSEVEGLPQSPEVSLPSLPAFSEPAINREKVSIRETLSQLEKDISSLISFLNNISVNLKVESDFDLSFTRNEAIKSFEMWQRDKAFIDSLRQDIDLSTIESVVRGDVLVPYIFSEEFVRAIADFSNELVRRSPVAHVKTFSLESELDQIASDAIRRGFSDDVVDGGMYYDLTLHKVKTYEEMTDQKFKTLTVYNDRVWRMVKSKTDLYHALCSYTLISYFTLVDLITKYWSFRIRQVEERINTVYRFTQFNAERIRLLLSYASTQLTKMQVSLRQLLDASEIKKEILDRQADATALSYTSRKLSHFAQQVRLLAGRVRQDLLSYILYRLKASTVQQRLRLESLKNDEVLLANTNEITKYLVDLTDTDQILSKLSFLNQVREAKYNLLRMEVSYIESILSKYKFSPEFLELLRQIRNLQFQLSKFSVESRGERAIRDTFVSEFHTRSISESYDYRLLMRKILYDTERAFDLALMHLNDRLSKESTKYNTLGDYYEKQIRGVLSSAHTVVSLTNKITEEQ